MKDPLRKRVVARFLRRAFNLSLDEAYKVLRLSPGASPDDIKKSYLQLALRYHPDRQGGDTEMMQKINAAREVIESGGAAKPSAPSWEPRAESDWARYRARYGPQPSGNYSDSDLERFAKDVIDNNLLQVILRYVVPHVPFDTGTNRGGHWSYYRPFGGKTRTRRLKDVDAATLYSMLKSMGKGRIFDMVVKDKEAWITWELPHGEYQSVSFEEVKVPKKKQPGVGMTPMATRDYMTANGFAIVAGGSKFAYWGPRGYREKTGRFIREAKKTLRMVLREKRDRKIEDIPLLNEVYYGKMTPALLDKWMDYIKKS